MTKLQEKVCLESHHNSPSDSTNKQWSTKELVLYSGKWAQVDRQSVSDILPSFSRLDTLALVEVAGMGISALSGLPGASHDLHSSWMSPNSVQSTVLRRLHLRNVRVDDDSSSASLPSPLHLSLHQSSFSQVAKNVAEAGESVACLFPNVVALELVNSSTHLFTSSLSSPLLSTSPSTTTTSSPPTLASPAAILPFLATSPPSAFHPQP
jgi:hypothetical protein